MVRMSRGLMWPPFKRNDHPCGGRLTMQDSTGAATCKVAQLGQAANAPRAPHHAPGALAQRAQVRRTEAVRGASIRCLNGPGACLERQLARTRRAWHAARSTMDRRMLRCRPARPLQGSLSRRTATVRGTPQGHRTACEAAYDEGIDEPPETVLRSCCAAHLGHSTCRHRSSAADAAVAMQGPVLARNVTSSSASWSAGAAAIARAAVILTKCDAELHQDAYIHVHPRANASAAVQCSRLATSAHNRALIPASCLTAALPSRPPCRASSRLYSPTARWTLRRRQSAPCLASVPAPSDRAAFVPRRTRGHESGAQEIATHTTRAQTAQA